MKFDFIIGNPPYQEETTGTSDKPIYNLFMDAAYAISDKVMLITPARFLFKAGKTPKDWDEKMLMDNHFKVLLYKQSSDYFFPNTDIKGGVAITYRDKTQNFGAIKVFLHFEELNSIKAKVEKCKGFASFSDLVYAPESYKFTEKMHAENPDIQSKLSDGHLNDVTTNIFDKIPELFLDNPPNSKKYVGIYGVEARTRVTKWIKRDYIRAHDNLDYYKVFLPKSNGSGELGETLSTPVIGMPSIGHTQTFISIGKFKTEEEAEALLKYIKTKFARTLLGIRKITQDNKKAVWEYVPSQDFTSSSDIDWTKSVAEIDQQLYAKYGFDEKEIAFIKSHAKEME